MFSLCFPLKSRILKGPKPKYTVKSSMGEFFFDCGIRFAGRTCQVDAVANKVESYSNVKGRGTRVALELQKRGIGANDVVAICSTHTLDNIIPMMACFYIGATLTNYDVTLSVSQLSYLLTLVTPKIIFVEKPSVELIEQSLKNANLTTPIVVFGKSEKYSSISEFLKSHRNEAKFEPYKADLNDIAVIFYSSGTTGLPKAVCHSHYGFLNTCYSCIQTGFDFTSTLNFSPFYWISALITMTCTMIYGGQNVFTAVKETKHIFDVVQKYQVTFLFTAPLMTYRFTNFDHLAEYDVSSLRDIALGGTPINPLQLHKVWETFKHAIVTIVYGMSEGGVIALLKQRKKFKKTNMCCCGKPLPGVTVKIVDLNTEETLGPNESGEICVKGEALMKGYYHDYDKSLFFDADGFLKTGDVGYYDNEGLLYVIDRVKEIFKYMYATIVPAAIEMVLMEHPDVKEAMVFGIPVSMEEGEKPAACIVLNDNCEATESEIEDFVAKRVTDPEKLRGGIWFTKALPKTPTGKVVKRELKDHILESL